MTNRRILRGLVLLALTLFACAGSAWAATFKNPALGDRAFYRDGSVLSPLRPAFVTRSQAVAAARAARKKSTAPVIKRITPLQAKLGDKLTIYGKNFVAGKGKTRVFFLRVGGGAAWVRSVTGTKTKVVVVIPTALGKLLPIDGRATRFQIRVLGKRFGSPTRVSRSPMISGPAGANSGTNGPVGASAVIGPTNGVGGCTPNFTDPTVDSDGDLLPDVEEHRIGTDPCNKDTDLDGVEDGYEYYSSKDLNSDALPYPWKMPYPNALFPDSTVDYDGDGLTLSDEFALWIKYGNHQLPLNYSDGKQSTVATPAPPAGTLLNWSLEQYGDTTLDDGERDADGDGLSNWDESHGRMTPDWWKAAYDGTNGPLETPYPVKFAGTNMMDPDTDGDGLVDGQDDNDFDGYSNMFEVHRPGNWPATYVSSGVAPPAGAYIGHNWNPLASPMLAGGSDPYARTNPLNPCKPLWSSICHQHPPFGYYGATEDWAAPTQDQVVAEGGSTPGTTP
jgi:hypothetical protein